MCKWAHWKPAGPQRDAFHENAVVREHQSSHSSPVLATGLQSDAQYTHKNHTTRPRAHADITARAATSEASLMVTFCLKWGFQCQVAEEEIEGLRFSSRFNESRQTERWKAVLQRVSYCLRTSNVAQRECLKVFSPFKITVSYIHLLEVCIQVLKVHLQLPLCVVCEIFLRIKSSCCSSKFTSIFSVLLSGGKRPICLTSVKERKSVCI